MPEEKFISLLFLEVGIKYRNQRNILPLTGEILVAFAEKRIGSSSQIESCATRSESPNTVPDGTSISLKGRAKPHMPTEPPAESAEARHRKQEKAVIDYLTSGSKMPTRPSVENAKPPVESTREEQEARELREALFKRWTSKQGGGLPDF